MAYQAPSKKLFLAMAGNIGSGKTTIAKIISQVFGFELFDEPVIDNRFLDSYYDDMKRWSFTLQLEFLIKRVKHHELIAQINKSCIQDRTLYEDPEVFAKYLHGLGLMTSCELDLYYDYFARLSKSIHMPDKVICVKVDNVDILLKRIRERGRASEITLAREFLEGLNGYYLALPQIFAKKYQTQVLTLDVSDKDIRTGPGREWLLDHVHTFLHQ